MSLTSTLRTAASGLNAAQAALRVTSDNIANVNTPGYVRKAVNQEPLVVNGVGQGVKIDGVERVTDQYLQMASLTAASDKERWSAVSEYLDNAQSLFGDPSADGAFFNRLDKIYAAFATAADDPSSMLLRSQALSTVEDFLNEASRINSQVVSLTDTVETRITAGVDRANALLEQISSLNADIKRASVVGADASGSENIQSQLLDELSGLMNVRINPRTGGGVDVRSLEGVLLAGDAPARLTYNATDSTPAYISARPAGSSDQPIELSSGELRGLMDLRDVELPKIYDQLGEFVSRAVDQLNAAHNDAAAYPPPDRLSGRNTGLDLPTAISGFSGTSTIAIVNSAGILQRSIAIDFSGPSISVNGAPGAPFTPASFLADLNTALTGVGSANFTDGVLTLNATGGNGLAIDEGTSSKTGRGFSQFFGLNDLVKATGFTNYATGLKPADDHGFTPGGIINLQLSSADGRPLNSVAVTVPAAPTTMTGLLNALNNNSTGVGLYGAFTLDANGVLSFTGSAPQNAKLSVITDNTARGVGGPSISQLFGLGTQERSARAGRFQVNSALSSDPTKMSVGKLDTAATVGQVAIRPGDGQGALAISGSGEIPILFQAAGSLGQVTMTLSRYGSEFGGAIGRGAEAAETRAVSAEAVAKEATNRRQSVEGVNLDEELVNLTTYQQAFNASARMIQAANELFDVLVNMV